MTHLKRIVVVFFTLGLVSSLSGQVQVGGLIDLELRSGAADSKPYVNQTPGEGLSLYTPHLRLFFDGDLDPAWRVTAALQSDFYGRKDLSPVFFSLLAVQWQPWSRRDMVVSAGRLIIPFGSYSERFLSSEHAFRHLPFSHEWTLPVDKMAGFSDAARNYEKVPGMTLVYNRMYTQGIALEGSAGAQGAVGYRLLWGMASPSGFYEYGEHGMQAVMGRLTWQPAIYLNIGASFGTGPYMKRAEQNEMLSDKKLASYRQLALGIDTEISYRYAVLKLEYILNRWTAPWIGSVQDAVFPETVYYFIEEDNVQLDGSYYAAELVYRIRYVPGLSVVARYERASFSGFQASGFYGSRSWFPDVQRVESGLTYTLSRNVKAKATYLYAVNEGTDLNDDTFGLQLSVGF